jgi:hypothetical protein
MEISTSSTTTKEKLILLVSGTCCVPQLALYDKQAEAIINQALDETGIKAQVRKLTIGSALSGGIPMEIIRSVGVAIDPSNIMRLPAVFIDNKFISFGVPKLDVIKSALTCV